MSLFTWGAMLFFAALAVAIPLGIWSGRRYWARRIERWAQAEGFTLLDFRGARFYEGPRPWRRTDSEFAFRVSVRGSDGRERSGWLTFGSPWSLWPRTPVEIRWDL
jgi:hypothetical protein